MMKTTLRPYVVAKIAQTVDGRIATRKGQSKWITGLPARQFARRKRDDFDGMMVGINTVLKDNPQLTGIRNKGLRKIIVDSKLRTPTDAKLLVGSTPGQCIIVTTRQADMKKVRNFRDRGIWVFICPQKSGKVDLAKAMVILKNEGIDRLLIEGGAGVIGNALKASLVDQMHIYQAPLIFGDEQSLGAFQGMTPGLIKESIQLKFSLIRRVGTDIFIQADVHGNR
jgi:diaminohydroxyphosphoribosylaminopyrimidine deaminase / 5-amino-6-(5-phosphoribosylamino)uracil reductase